MEGESKRKHVFISHHHKDDAEVTKLTNLLKGRGYDIRNSSIRAKPSNQKRLDEKRVPEAVLRRLLRMKISWAGTTLVLVGKETHQRPWVNWEIEQAHKQGKRIIGVYQHGGTEADVPKNFAKYGSALVNWNSDSIINAMEGGNNFTNPDGSARVGFPGSGGSITC
jgi:hypothetical protein